MAPERRGLLYLIPVSLGEDVDIQKIPLFNVNVINKLDEFIVENERTARRQLKASGYSHPINLIKFHLLDEHTDEADYKKFIASAMLGKDIGLLSESGCPCIADPGAKIVSIAQENNIKVVPLIGPTSIILSLMASGFNGQNFAFNGYLPVSQDKRVHAIKQLEAEVYKKEQTQIFIETPYRNIALFEDIIKNCSAQTKLCIATDITLSTEMIKTMTIEKWKKTKPDINKKPSIFLLYK